jgi:hypothetical protein
VQASSLASASITASGGSLNQALSVVSLNSDYTLGELERGKLMNWTGGAGEFPIDLASTLGDGWFVHVKNSGEGALTVTPTSPDEIDGEVELIINPGESTIVASDGDNFFTISRVDNVISNFTYLSMSVAGTGDITLSAAQQGYSAYRFTGILTGNRNVIMPTVAAQFIVRNETTGSFTMTVKTAAGTGVVVGTNESKLLFCDGTNVKDAATAGISTPVAVVQGGTGATTASAARTNLGFTSIGNAIGTAANATQVRTAAGFSAIGDALATAASASAARTTLGSGAIGDALFLTTSTATAKTAIGLGNVENYSAANLPLSTAATSALSGKAPIGGVGGNFVVGSATIYTDGNINMPWYGNTLAVALGSKISTSSNATLNTLSTAANIAVGTSLSVGTSFQVLAGSTMFGGINLVSGDLTVGTGTLNCGALNSGTLHANGNIYSGGEMIVEGFTTTGNAGNTYMTTGGRMQRSTSSARYKKDIETWGRPYAQIDRLRPVFYRGLNPADGDKTFGGVISEEVMEAGFPEFVEGSDGGTLEGVHYGPMGAVLAIKAHDRIRELEDVVEQLLAAVRALQEA